MMLALVTFSASAQFGPPRGDPNQPNPRPNPDPGPSPQPHNNPGPTPNPQPAGLGTPGWLVPGYQATFSQLYSNQPNPTNDPNQPAPKGRTSQSLFEYTAIAVTQDQVIFQVNEYEGAKGLPMKSDGTFDPSIDGKYRFVSSYYDVVDAKKVSRGGTIWLPVPLLADLEQNPIQQPQTAEQNGLQTAATTWPYAGQQINALSIQLLAKDYTELKVFNRETGMRMFIRTGEGKPRKGAPENDPFQREEMVFESFVGESPVNNPLLNRPFPDWTRSVKSMRFQGTQTAGGSQNISLPIAATLTVEQNDGHLMAGKILLQAQGAPDKTEDVYMGPGSSIGYWVDPAVLGQLQEGRVHRNDITRCNLYYRVQDTELGRLGVFVHYNDSQSFTAVNGYNLEDGSLVYLKFSYPETGVERELYLKNIEGQ